MFDLQQVHRRFGQATGLAGIDLHIAPGRTTALIGPSGAGKSTLLRLLVGLEWPDHGEVRFDGVPLQRAQLPALRRRIGYVIQEGGLFPHLDAAGNIALLARTLGWSPPRIEARTAELAALCQLPDDALRRYPAELSGGMAQRTALGRTLLQNPDIILMDEPFGALDYFTRKGLQETLLDLFRLERKTIIFVTHDVEEAILLGERVLIMQKGRITGEIPVKLAYPRDPAASEILSLRRQILAGLD